MLQEQSFTSRLSTHLHSTAYACVHGCVCMRVQYLRVWERVRKSRIAVRGRLRNGVWRRPDVVCIEQLPLPNPHWGSQHLVGASLEWQAIPTVKYCWIPTLHRSDHLFLHAKAHFHHSHVFWEAQGPWHDRSKAGKKFNLHKKLSAHRKVKKMAVVYHIPRVRIKKKKSFKRM